ncbi:MAG: zinc-ribbon domain-containing protein [Oscillospiraceae bacterium]
MKNCPYCESSIVDIAKFCDQCGKEQPIICNKCGLALRDTAKFCEQCGTSVEKKHIIKELEQKKVLVAKQQKQVSSVQNAAIGTKEPIIPVALPITPKLVGTKQGIAAYTKNNNGNIKSVSPITVDDDIIDFGTMIQTAVQQDTGSLHEMFDTGSFQSSLLDTTVITNIKYGNELANIMGGYGFNGYSAEPKGNVAYYDGWVYLFDVVRKNANTLAKMREDGSQLQILYKEEPATTQDFLIYVNVDDTYIYYTYAQCIIRIKKDGSNREVLVTNANGACYSNLILMDGTLYFSYAGSDNDTLMPTIFSVKNDGTLLKKIATIKDCFPNHNIITGTNTWLTIFGIDTRKIICDMRVRFFNNKGDFDRCSMKYIMNLDGTQIQAIPTLFDYTKLLDEMGESCTGSMMEHFSKLVSYVDLGKDVLYLNTKHTIYQLHMKTQMLTTFLTDFNSDFQSINGYFNGVTYVDVLPCQDQLKRLTIFDVKTPSKTVENAEKSWWYNIVGRYIYWHAGIENFQVTFCRVKLDGTGYEELCFKKE